MQITAAETMIVEIPFPFPQTGTGIGLNAWRSLEFTLVRLEDEQGNIGWGEGFGYSTVESTKAMIDRLLVPRLLAGPVDLVMASGYVGRTEIGFVAAGEKLALGFGPEADVRIHRSEARERDDAGLLGGWNVTTVRVALRLSNLGARPRVVVVTERIPISEVEQVEVHASAPEAYLLEDAHGEDITQVTARALDERGLVTWSVELPPHGRRAVTLEYKIKSQRGVAGASGL